MQVSTLNPASGLVSEIVDWWGDAQLFLIVIYWLTCRHEKTMDDVFVRTLIPFLEYFIPRTGWSNQNFWTMNTQNFFILQVFQSFSHKFKHLFLHYCPKVLIRTSYGCLVSLLDGNLQSRKRRHHVTKLRNEVQLLLLVRITWKQRRDVLASEKVLELIKVITHPLNNPSPWYVAVCCCHCFCVQQQQ